MRKNIALSVVVLGVIGSAPIHAAEDLSSMFSEGKTSGEIRAFYIDREYQGGLGKDIHRNSTAVGGNLKLETADYRGFRIGSILYTTNEIPAFNYSDRDPTLLGTGNESYSILGEVYINFDYKETTFKGGRQKLATPMAGADDTRMLPNLFNAYLLINRDIPNTTIMVGHIDGFAQGTFGRVYDPAAGGGSSLLAVTSGYSAVDTRNQTGKFLNMGAYAVGKETAGVSIASLTYKEGGFKAQLWDYYAYDILNAVYAQGDYSWSCLLSDKVKPYVAGQLINESDVGKEYAGKINSVYLGAKIGAKIENFNAYIAYSQTTANSASDLNGAKIGTANAIVTPWGGMPAFTHVMVTRHQFLAGTKATKVAASYNFKDIGANVSTALYYASFDMHANSGYGIARTATEPGFDIKYHPSLVKNLQLRLRGNFPRSFAESTAGGDTGWDEYRVIANYTF
ncbi:MAG: porin [Campylobacterota bacterium]|nr:porin [Campylobacterota bacterium]